MPRRCRREVGTGWRRGMGHCPRASSCRSCHRRAAQLFPHRSVTGPALPEQYPHDVVRTVTPSQWHRTTQFPTSRSQPSPHWLFLCLEMSFIPPGDLTIILFPGVKRPTGWLMIFWKGLLIRSISALLQDISCSRCPLHCLPSPSEQPPCKPWP